MTVYGNFLHEPVSTEQSLNKYVDQKHVTHITINKPPDARFHSSISKFNCRIRIR